MGKFLSFIAAFLVLNIIGASVSTQFNLGHLVALGADISFATRLSTTLHDIVKMQPLFAAIFGTGLLIALLVGTLITRWVKVLPSLVFALAGFAAVMTTLLALKAAFQITAIGATRELDGFISLCLVGAFAGYVYARVSARLNMKT